MTEFKIRCWLTLYWIDAAIVLAGLALYMLRWPIVLGLLAYVAFFR